MAELLCGSFIPVEELIVKGSKKVFNDYLKLGYEVRYKYGDIYHLTRKPTLQVILRQDERDYVFDFLEEASRFFKKRVISHNDASKFIIRIAQGKIKVTINPDGTYILK